MDKLLFDNWDVIQRTAAIAVLAYATLLLFLRLSGKRALSKLNAFDLVVTVALGSTLATILLSKDVAMAEGALALALLLFFQFLITWTSVRVAWFRRVITGEPTLLLHQGRLIPEALKRARVTEAEVMAALRAAGHACTTSILAVVLETDGSISVIPEGEDGERRALNGIENFPPPPRRD